MKKSIILSVLLMSSFGASALNLQIPSPVKADRIGLVSEITFKTDCSKRSFEVVSESNVFVARHVKKYINQICYKDANSYTVSMKFGGGKDSWHEKNMLSTDPGRSIKTPVVVNYK